MSPLKQRLDVERTKLLNFSRTVLAGRGFNPVSAIILYLLLLLREFHSGLAKTTNTLWDQKRRFKMEYASLLHDLESKLEEYLGT